MKSPEDLENTPLNIKQKKLIRKSKKVGRYLKKKSPNFF